MSEGSIVQPAAALSPVAEVLAHDGAEARAYGAEAAGSRELAARTWEEVAPRLRDGWMSWQGQLCDPSHDWRLSFPEVREGWREAGGPFEHA